jgi:uncharacterized protein
MIKYLLLSLALGVTQLASAASFDCQLARTTVEQLICNDTQLSGADEELSQLYQRVLAGAGDQAALKAEQRQWLTTVRNRCADLACLENAYAARFTALSQQTAAAPAEVPAVPEPALAAPTASPADAVPAAVQEPAAAPVPTQLTQPVQLATSPTAVTPSAAATASASSDIPRLLIKIGVVLLIVNALSAIYLHRRQRLTIYSDYTDATLTGLWPVLALLVYALACFLEVPQPYAVMLGWGAFGVVFVVVALSTLRTNGASLYFLMALLAKMTLVGVYYAIIALLLLGSGSARRKGERLSSFEARQRREAAARTAAVAGTTTAYVALSMWLCRNPQFTPLGHHLRLRA